LGWRLLDECAVHGWRSGYIDEALAIYRSAPFGGSRHPDNFARRLTSYEHLLAKHADRFARDPSLYAIHWSLAGAAAARLGEIRKARDYFEQAVRWDRRNLRHRLRFLLIRVPVVRERFWLRHYP
jgi:hypothetical protein